MTAARTPGSNAGSFPMSVPDSFGFLRLLFASFVIISHSPEVLDGNRSRELLTRTFGSLSFGELGVSGFFLISGYLIVQSCRNSASPAQYLTKRFLRIYPGFAVSFLICWLLVGPISGGTIVQTDLAGQLLRLLTLSEPSVVGSFSGLHYPVLNGPMWTIIYEFRCYVIVLFLHMAGILENTKKYAIILTGFLVIYVISIRWPGSGQTRDVVQYLADGVRFVMFFFVGGAFYVLRHFIRLEGATALGAGIVGLGLMFVAPLAYLAVAMFGAYVLFWFALRVGTGWLSRIGRTVDISYGVYLYAWPIQNLLVQQDSEMSPVLLAILTMATASVLGFLSWTFVEGPCMRLKQRFRTSAPPDAS